MRAKLIAADIGSSINMSERIDHVAPLSLRYYERVVLCEHIGLLQQQRP